MSTYTYAGELSVTSNHAHLLQSHFIPPKLYPTCSDYWNDILVACYSNNDDCVVQLSLNVTTAGYIYAFPLRLGCNFDHEGFYLNLESLLCHDPAWCDYVNKVHTNCNGILLKSATRYTLTMNIKFTRAMDWYGAKCSYEDGHPIYMFICLVGKNEIAQSPRLIANWLQPVEIVSSHELLAHDTRATWVKHMQPGQLMFRDLSFPIYNIHMHTRQYHQIALAATFSNDQRPVIQKILPQWVYTADPTELVILGDNFRLIRSLALYSEDNPYLTKITEIAHHRDDAMVFTVPAVYAKQKLELVFWLSNGVRYNTGHMLCFVPPPCDILEPKPKPKSNPKPTSCVYNYPTHLDAMGNQVWTEFDALAYHGMRTELLCLAKISLMDINRKNTMGTTCAIYAALYNDHELMHILIQNGLKFCPTTDGVTALHIAALCCNTEMIRILTTYSNVNLYERDALGQTVLHYANSSAYTSDEQKQNTIAYLLDLDNGTLRDMPNVFGDTYDNYAPESYSIIELVDPLAFAQNTFPRNFAGLNINYPKQKQASNGCKNSIRSDTIESKETNKHN